MPISLPSSQEAPWVYSCSSSKIKVPLGGDTQSTPNLFYFLTFFLIGGKLLYNVALVSAIQHE